MFRRRRVTEQETLPPPRGPLLWPWLLLLLLLVLGGIGLAYYLTRDDDGSPENRVPAVVGMRAPLAVERLRERGYPADVRRRVSQTQLGRVLDQDPDAGLELEPGRTVVLIVAGLPSTVDVPNVVGLTAAEAFERVQAAKLKPEGSQIVSRSPKGIVVRQQPASGAEAPRGSTVALSISKGPQLVAVPAVVGQTAAAAGSTLRRLGFQPKAFPVPSKEPEGMVIAQVPRAGVRAPKGSAVRINVARNQPLPASTGPPQPTDTGPPPSARATVPNVVGRREADAVTRLERAGFRVNEYPVTSSRPAGTVVSQRPGGGSSAPSGSAVRIDISVGTELRKVKAVPDVVGQDEVTARRTLRAAGFLVRTIDRPTSEQTENGIVLDQNPDGGQDRQVYTQVIIYVGRLA